MSTTLAEAPSRKGDEQRLDFEHYRNAVKARMRKWDRTGERVAPTEEEVDRFLFEALVHGLEPLADQIYPSWKEGVMKSVIPNDGLRAQAERSGRYAGQSDPEWCDRDGNWTVFWSGDEPPVAARVRIFKKGTDVPTTGTANWSDFAQNVDDPNSMWHTSKGRPAHHLGRRAEEIGLRKAFPAELSGLYTFEELNISPEEIGAGGEESDPPAPATDVPAGPGVSRPAGSVQSPAPNGSEVAPAVIVDAPAGQPSGAPALPQVKRTLAEALASTEYGRVHGDLTNTLFDQLPDRLTDEQSEILAEALAEAEEAEVTPVELERLCRVALAECRDNVESRRRVLLRWISERRQKVEERAPTSDGQRTQASGPVEQQATEDLSLLDADPGPEGRA